MTFTTCIFLVKTLQYSQTIANTVYYNMLANIHISQEYYKLRNKLNFNNKSYGNICTKSNWSLSYGR